MIVRCGLPTSYGLIPRRAAEMEYDILISAGSLWDNNKKSFKVPGKRIWECNSVALDSAGFVATKLHGGYRWSVQQYVELASTYNWIWWSQMDFCCEPEIASDSVIVRNRVTATADMLLRCRIESEGKCIPPMPILQGWCPDDYRLCGDKFDVILKAEWPNLVGVGSVCRRQMSGPTGLWAILASLDRWLPPHVKLHLFGVKGDAIPELSQNPRIESTDSCAWDFGTRRQVQNERIQSGLPIREATKLIPNTTARRATGMVSWMELASNATAKPRQVSMWEL